MPRPASSGEFSTSVPEGCLHAAGSPAAGWIVLLLLAGQGIGGRPRLPGQRGNRGVPGLGHQHRRRRAGLGVARQRGVPELVQRGAAGRGLEEVLGLPVGQPGPVVCPVPRGRAERVQACVHQAGDGSPHREVNQAGHRSRWSVATRVSGPRSAVSARRNPEYMRRVPRFRGSRAWQGRRRRLR